MKLNDKLYELRRNQHLSQEQLAQELGLSRQAISKWENDENKPDLDNLKKLANIFHVKVEYLINDDAIDDSLENNHIQKKEKTNKKHIILAIASALLCLFLGFYIGNQDAESKVIAQFLNTPKLITDFNSSPNHYNHFVRTLETMPAFYHSSLKAEYTVINQSTQTETKYPAHYDGRAFVSDEIDFDLTTYSIYITFSFENIDRNILISDNFLV